MVPAVARCFPYFTQVPKDCDYTCMGIVSNIGAPLRCQ